MSCSALLFTDSPTSAFPASSAASVSSSCALVSSRDPLHVSSGRGNGRLPVPPFSSSSSSSFCLSLSGLNRSSGSTQPGEHPFNPAEMRTGGAYCALGTGLLCPSLQGCAAERLPGRAHFCSLATRLPACRRQSSLEQQQRQLNEEGLRIYRWMRRSGADRRRGRPVPHTAATDRDCARALPHGAADQDLVPKPEDEVEEGEQSDREWLPNSSFTDC